MGKKRGKEEEKVSLDNLFYLQPKETIKITGKISYKERLRAFGLIQLRKEIINVFPQLRERRGNFRYTMVYNRSHKEVRKILEAFEKEGLMPILLFLGRTKEENK